MLSIFKKNDFLFLVILILAFVLRFWQLDRNPPSLYWDEVSLGYNAYSISQTAKDEHGQFLPLTNFAAFGDYKPPGYIYTDVLPIKIFGVNEFSIRFPSAFFGFLTVFVTYFLAKLLFGKREIALLSTLFLAVSPWHLQLSRGAFEANLATFFSILAIWLFLKGIKEKGFWFLPSFLLFVLAVYTFNAQKVFVPLLIIAFGLVFLKEIWRKRIWFFLSLVLFIVLSLPMLQFSLSPAGRLRFQEVSIFNNLEPIEKSNEWRHLDQNSWWANIIHNRRVFFSLDFLSHYLDHFKSEYLFFTGDVNPRLSPQDIGELYILDLPFLILGVYFLLAKKQKFALPIFVWLLLSPIPAATARETPHALRTEHILPTFQLISAFGIFSLWEIIKEKSLVKKFYFPVFFLLLGLNVFYYLHNYYTHYPLFYSGQWQDGHKKMVEFVKDRQDKYEKIVVTQAYGRPYIYFLFYQNYDPEKFQKNVRKRIKDFGFFEVLGFDKFEFRDDFSNVSARNILYVVLPNHLPPNSNYLTTIKKIDGTPVFDIGEKI